MDKQNSLTPFELELKALLDVPEPDADYVQGLRGWLVRNHRPAFPSFWPLPRPTLRLALLGAALAAVLLVLLAYGPERVVAGVRLWLSRYIPGVGFVDNETDLRVLEQPVTINAAGASIQVEKGYTSAEETAILINYGDDTRACKNTDITYEQYRARLAETVYLLLPDGRKLPALTPRFAAWGKFPPLPAGVNEAVLMVPPNVIHPCKMGERSTFCQCMDEDLRWMILLKFARPAPGSVLPVVDGSTPTALPVLTATAPPAPETPSAQAQATLAPTAAPQVPAEPQPELAGKLVKLDDGYLILVVLKRSEQGGASFRFGLNQQPVTLTGADGSAIALEPVERREINPQVFEDIPPGDTAQYRVSGAAARAAAAAGPLKLTFPVLTVSEYGLGAEAVFAMDLGDNPQVGQRIPQEAPLDFIPGHPFALKTVSIDTLDASTIGVTLTFAGEGFETVMLEPAEGDPMQGGSSGQCEDFPGCFYASTGLPLAPGHRYRVKIGMAEHTVKGPWSIEFDLKE